MNELETQNLFLSSSFTAVAINLNFMGFVLIVYVQVLSVKCLPGKKNEIKQGRELTYYTHLRIAVSRGEHLRSYRRSEGDNSVTKTLPTSSPCSPSAHPALCPTRIK
jgi:hypothetical protein